MAIPAGYKLQQQKKIKEINGDVFYYIHEKTGAKILSIVNNDENKVFGITFRTPPKSSNGIAHIMEHSVLCGSRKYPVKEPFVELMKGSLNTFLNAFTYPDKTCYPVASTNVKDFYNLVDVYLDAVFFPIISKEILQQEGWHFELENKDDPLIFKGVVFNEMKGAYSSPNRIVAEASQHSIFPDTTYGVESGGHPEVIPDLTYQEFLDFHKTYYHPANAYIYFYGNDDPQKRLKLLDEYLNAFEPARPNSHIELQKRFSKPVKKTVKYYAGSDLDGQKKGVVTVNYLISDSLDLQKRLELGILDHIMIGTQASPLRKALIDSDYGEDLSGHGLETEMRQMYYSIGLRGIDEKDAGKVEQLIYDTFAQLAREGFDRDAIAASMNTVEFSLRENNTGSYPRGLSTMLDVLTVWLHDEDPIAAIEYEDDLARLKKNIRDDERFFEKLIETYFLHNNHRTTLVFEPDASIEKNRDLKEKQRLEAAKGMLSEAGLEAIIAETATLKQRQITPDSPEALATIPKLGLEDINKIHKPIPIEVFRKNNAEVVFHDLFTNGIFYFTLGFNMQAVPERLLPMMNLFGRVLLESGTAKEDRVALSQRIGKHTGGIWRSNLTSTHEVDKKVNAYFTLRGKTVLGKVEAFFDIMRDIVESARIDDKSRFKQIVLDAKSRFENSLASSGHSLAQGQLAANLTESGKLSDRLSGITYLNFLRGLVHRIENDWANVEADLALLKEILITKNGIICNCTTDAASWKLIEPVLDGFLNNLPDKNAEKQTWPFEKTAGHQGFSIPAQVNFVGKGALLYDYGYAFNGSALVINKYLRTSWFWDRVRVQGGAYGGFSNFNRKTGLFTMLSYRDPNLLKTLDVYDETAAFLRNAKIDKDELVKSIIGTIGDIDAYMLPDAKGNVSFYRYLAGTSDAFLQQIRDEVLATTPEDFRRFGEVLEAFKTVGNIAVVGSEEALDAANEKMGKEWLKITKVL